MKKQLLLLFSIISLFISKQEDLKSFFKRQAKSINSNKKLSWKAINKVLKQWKNWKVEDLKSLVMQSEIQDFKIPQLDESLIVDDNCVDLIQGCGGMINQCYIMDIRNYCKKTCQTCTSIDGPALLPGVNPTNYDFTTQYPQCAGPIQNQFACGDCYAVSPTTQMSQTYCKQQLSTNSKFQFLQFSPLPIVTCGLNGQGSPNGCSGANPTNTYNYALNHGLTTFNCNPFNGTVFASCGNLLCNIQPNGDKKTPICTNWGKCYLNQVPYKTYKIKSFVQIEGIEHAFMNALQTGPYSITINVYDAFFNYKSGIFTCDGYQGKFVGQHVLTVVGYGVENGVNYWKLQNSYGAAWGEQGFFRIRRGQNDCSIESGFAYQGVF